MKEIVGEYHDIRESHCPLTAFKGLIRQSLKLTPLFFFKSKEGKQTSIFSDALLMTVTVKLQMMSEQCLTIKGECVPDL